MYYTPLLLRRAELCRQASSCPQWRRVESATKPRQCARSFVWSASCRHAKTVNNEVLVGTTNLCRQMQRRRAARSSRAVRTRAALNQQFDHSSLSILQHVPLSEITSEMRRPHNSPLPPSTALANLCFSPRAKRRGTKLRPLCEYLLS